MTAPNWRSVDPGPVALRPLLPFRCSSCVEHWRAGLADRVLAHRLRSLLLQLEDRLCRERREIQEYERQRGRQRLQDAQCQGGGCTTAAVAVLHVDDGPPLLACESCTADWAAGDRLESLQRALDEQSELLARVHELAPHAVAAAAAGGEAGAPTTRQESA